MSQEPDIIAVKRDGPRGWHWIARANYDPAVHVLHELHPLDHDGNGHKGGSLPHKLAVITDGSGEELPPVSNEPRVAPARKRVKKEIGDA